MTERLTRGQLRNFRILEVRRDVHPEHDTKDSAFRRFGWCSACLRDHTTLPPENLTEKGPDGVLFVCEDMSGCKPFIWICLECAQKVVDVLKPATPPSSGDTFDKWQPLGRYANRGVLFQLLLPRQQAEIRKLFPEWGEDLLRRARWVKK